MRGDVNAEPTYLAAACAVSGGTYMLVVAAIAGALVAGYLILWLVSAKQRGQQAERVRIAEAKFAMRKAEFDRQVEEIELELLESWPAKHTREISDLRREYLLMSQDQRRFCSLLIDGRDGFTVKWSDPVEIASVVSVELQQNATTIMRLETTATSKKFGVLGRAVVGGVLFGGVGAVVGAATSGSKITATTKSTSQTRKGPVILVVGTTDVHQPVIRHYMNNRDEGEQWLHRLRGAVALRQES